MNIIKPHGKDVTEKLNIKLLNLWSTLLTLWLSGTVSTCLCLFSCTEMHNAVKWLKHILEIKLYDAQICGS